MPRKRNPSIIPRFTGAAGRKNLLAAICSQQAVAGNAHLARRLISVGALHEFKAYKPIVRQGDTDNDIYMIVSGSVNNGAFGEIALSFRIAPPDLSKMRFYWVFEGIEVNIRQKILSFVKRNYLLPKELFFYEKITSFAV